MQSIYKNNTGHLLTQDEPPVFLPQKDNEKTFYRWYRLILLAPYDQLIPSPTNASVSVQEGRQYRQVKMKKKCVKFTTISKLCSNRKTRTYQTVRTLSFDMGDASCAVKFYM